MAHFFAQMRGRLDGMVKRVGNKLTGMLVTVAGWQGAIETHVWHDEKEGVDRFRVRLIPWRKSSSQEARVLAEGVLDSAVKPS